MTFFESAAVTMVVFFLSFRLIYDLSVLLHEAGHILGGLLLNQELTMFEFKKKIWIKRSNGRFEKIESPYGRMGACVMSAKENADPYQDPAIHELGGVFMNALVAIACFIPLFTMQGRSFIHSVCLCVVLINILMVYRNAVPDKKGRNDGCHFKRSRQKQSRYYSFRFGKITDAVRLGQSAADVPEEWFQLPTDADLSDPEIAALARLKTIYYDDIGQYDLMVEYAEYLLSKDVEMSLTSKASLIMLIMMDELVNSDTYEKTMKLYTDEIMEELFRVPLKNGAHTRLFLYAYALLVEQDEQTANAELKQFQLLQKQQLFLRDQQSAERAYQRLKQKILEQDSDHRDMTPHENVHQ